MTANNKPLRKMLSLAKEERSSLAVGTFFLLITSGLNLTYPMLLGQMVDEIGEGKGIEVVNHYVGIMLVLFVFVGIATFFRAYLFTVAGERIVTHLQQRLFGSIIKQEIAFFDTRQTGELTNRLASDTTVLQKAVTVNISMGLRFSLSAIGATCILMWISWRLALLMLAVVPVVAALAGIYGRMLRRISLEVQDALAESTAIAEESISGVRTVRSFARELWEQNRYRDAVEKAFVIAKRRAFYGASFSGGISFAGYASIIAVLWYGGEMLANGEMAFGELTSFMLYTFTVAFSIGALSGLYEDFAKAIGATERVFTLLDRDCSLLDGEFQLESPSGEIQFSNVTFSYPTRPEVEVLRNFSISIERGEVVALVGPSGGGKSTVATLISRFYDPQKGQIFFDKHPLPSLKKDWLREQVGVVSQEPILFAASIHDNILYGRPNASVEDVLSAAKAANADQFIKGFPEGYETLVGERGVRLSGGQKQRIAIARALLKDPRFLILDEATSALDAQSEHLVQEALERLMVGRSTLVIAHRLSTIQNANRVAVLQQGQIVEIGSHDELLSQQGLYHQLIERQFTD
jgi:ABC transporter fused permease/ATP-binding protein